MISKIATVIIGIIFIWVGINVLKEGWSHLYGHPIPKVTGVFILFFGFYLVLGGFFPKARNKRNDEEFLICPTCRKPFGRGDFAENQCPICETDLENLEGFYERHPEVKEK